MNTYKTRRRFGRHHISEKTRSVFQESLIRKMGQFPGENIKKSGGNRVREIRLRGAVIAATADAGMIEFHQFTTLIPRLNCLRTPVRRIRKKINPRKFFAKRERVRSERAKNRCHGDGGSRDNEILSIKLICVRGRRRARGAGVNYNGGIITSDWVTGSMRDVRRPADSLTRHPFGPSPRMPTVISTYLLSRPLRLPPIGAPESGSTPPLPAPPAFQYPPLRLFRSRCHVSLPNPGMIVYRVIQC